MAELRPSFYESGLDLRDPTKLGEQPTERPTTLPEVTATEESCALTFPSCQLPKGS